MRIVSSYRFRSGVFEEVQGASKGAGARFAASAAVAKVNLFKEKRKVGIFINTQDSARSRSEFFPSPSLCVLPLLLMLLSTPLSLTHASNFRSGVGTRATFLVSSQLQSTDNAAR